MWNPQSWPFGIQFKESGILLTIGIQGPVPGRQISADPGSKFSFHFNILPSYVLLRVTFCVIITVSRSKGSTYFASSSRMFLDKKTLLQISLNPGLKLTIFRGTGSRYLRSTDKDWSAVPGIRSPRRGIQNPRLSWIPLYGATDSH